MNISVAWEGGEDGGDLLCFGSGESRGHSRDGCAPQKEAGSFVRASGAAGSDAGGSCGEGCQLPYLLIAWADGVIVAWR